MTRRPGTRATMPGRHVRRAPTDGRVAIVVADRGAGIAAADLPRVFDPYFTTKRGGTGLGLPIAKNIVEGLGGAIRDRQRSPARAPRFASSCPSGRCASDMTRPRIRFCSSTTRRKS